MNQLVVAVVSPQSFSRWQRLKTGAAKISSSDAVAGDKNVLFSYSKRLYNDNDDDDDF